jgi:excinuclease ABC subunit B
MYADGISPAMDYAINETGRRRKIQMDYNEKHGITPKTIEKSVREVIEATKVAEAADDFYEGRSAKEMTFKERQDYIKKLEKDMKEAAKNLEFERAANLRDRIMEMKVQ